MIFSDVPVSLYIHVPWCLQKCPYCDFSSMATRRSIDQAAFFSAILRDITMAVEQYDIQPFSSVFLGGGTPSLLDPRRLGQFLDVLSQRKLISGQTEITLEANPATIERHHFSDFVLAGVNRLSLGIQSFQDRHLLTLGRIHDRRQAIEAISSAVAACDNVSIDLMYALPGQRLSDSDADLSVALSFDIRHLSLYQLTIEENTVFGRMLPGNLPDDDTVETMEYQIRQKLGEAGFTQYETSAFAKDASKQCQHNLNYWLFGDYLGVGPGAHSKLHQENVTIRQMRPFSVSNYLSDGSVAIESWTLSTSDILTEIVMNAGRLTQGFHLSKLAHHARLPISAFEPVVAYAIDQGYWFRHQDHIRPTEKGKRFLNQLLFEMLPEQNK